MQKKEGKAIEIAELLLAEKGYVAPIDILFGLGILTPYQLKVWQRGQVPYLEQVVQSNPNKINSYMKAFHKWAQSKGLKPSHTAYCSQTRDRHQLRFSKSGDPNIEENYATHYVSPTLSEKKQARIEAKQKAPELICYIVVKDRQCAQCKSELPKGSFLYLEKDEALCLSCADLDHLVYLPSGNTALTRRARKHSDLSIVVVRFSRTRKRYERQGVLVSEEALAKAEEECLSDEEVRARKREQAEVLRSEEDKRLAEAMMERIREIFPSCPAREAAAIATHTTVRSSGRVGRTAARRALEDEPIILAVRAYIRHRYTDYDKLLMKHGDRAYARMEIEERLEEVFQEWRGIRAGALSQISS